MNPMINKLDSLIDWVTTTRQSNPLFGYQADNLIVNLQRLKSRSRRLTLLQQQPLTLGLYGHNQAEKNNVLKTLIRPGSEQIEIILGDKIFDYLTHINPCNNPPAITVRFSQIAPVEEPHFPLQLALFSECELIYQFIKRYQKDPHHRTLSPKQISLRLNELQTRCQPSAIKPDYEADIAQLLQEYRYIQPCQVKMNEALEAQFNELAPRLSLNDRAELFSVFWGGDHSLTQEWRHLAQLLEQLGNPQQVLAPANLLVDSFMMPTEGFLTPLTLGHHYQTGDILICTLVDGIARSPLSVPQQDLAKICAEVILTTSSDTTLLNTDVLDIPLHQLDFYTHRLQADILLVYNAVDNPSEIATTSHALNHWLESTQITDTDQLPRLIWPMHAVQQFTHNIHLDKRVQRRLGKAGVRWGELYTPLLHDWLQHTLTTEQKNQRLTRLTSVLEKQIHGLFDTFIEEHQLTSEQKCQRVDVLVHALQHHILHLGPQLACLVPSHAALNECWLQTHQSNTDFLALNIDLFTREHLEKDICSDDVSYTGAIYRLWVNHLYTLLQETKNRSVSLLEPDLRHTFSEILITTSYRLGIPEQLARANAESNREIAVARSHRILSDFIAWLGYAGKPDKQRPFSRVNKPYTIFTPTNIGDSHQRLHKLSGPPQKINTNYAYDWLLALYTRGHENSHYQASPMINNQHYQKLLSLLR